MTERYFEALPRRNSAAYAEAYSYFYADMAYVGARVFQDDFAQSFPMKEPEEDQPGRVERRCGQSPSPAGAVRTGRVDRWGAETQAGRTVKFRRTCNRRQATNGSMLGNAPALPAPILLTLPYNE